MRRHIEIRLVLALLMALGTAAVAYGQSTIAADLTNYCAWGENVGWINARPSPADGAVIGEYVCQGYLYAANTGWIDLGDGTPTNGYRYSNTSHLDYGVNHDGLGHLRGLAWGANVGWIAFESVGAPAVDLVTGDLSGYAWGANIGWISLSNLQGAVRTLWLDSGPDDDGDGIPDAYEYFYTGTTDVFTAVSQSDADGVSDRDEYFSGTDPLDDTSYLRVVDFSAATTNIDITWTTVLRRQYYLEYGSAITNADMWSDSGLGLLVPGGAVMTRVVTLSGDDLQFWRIRAVRPLAE